ncbi:prolyl oligopeptidase family serine peptidase [Gemmatimonas sp.]|uniref:S9 family peptidase n=1 Tax=Gemmatimonas sp. TaxID=1962908 RepID=UPI00286DABAD|nr:prolyl oligopeptidase family serine peptidase [Gemmatimonas sp.]
MTPPAGAGPGAPGSGFGPGGGFPSGGGRGGFGQQDTTQLQQQQQQDDAQLAGAAANRPSRAAVTWSSDSKAFHITRTDNRGVKEMYLVRSLTDPRPTLMSYSYPMPGEDSIPKPELWTFLRGDKTAKKAPIDKWRDQRLVATPQVGVITGGGRGAGAGGPGGPGAGQGYFVGKKGDMLRFVRRDRLQRNVEFVELNIATGASKTLVSDTKGDFGSLEIQAPIYVKEGGDFIWFSERDGWGHYYLYSNDGKLKRLLTPGEWRADAVMAVDSIRGIAWIRGEGREKGENLYNQHLYRVGLYDGSIALLDGGNFNHNSLPSKNRNYIVDMASRVDTVPRVILRDGLTGRPVMDLEEADLSALKAAGWKYAETFEVLAADGVTRIFGNMWKPFDFDSTKKYPIITYVYPGPQTEGTTTGFSVRGPLMQLAQLGFIVIEVGHRGGSPLRSLAYHRYGYGNMRDYALADKKYAIEQLGARHTFIDLDKVGIFGHSGGGFMTAAALLLPPYNEFFKVGWSESGNHDNNIYNQNWSEWNHGVKVIAKADSAAGAVRAGGTGAARRGGPGANAAAKEVVQDSTNADKIKFDIRVPTNDELAGNLKGNLALATGDLDNNVHPGGTIRLANALIKANKRFDFFIYPGEPHGYRGTGPYNQRMLMEYFAEHLLGDYYRGNGEIK